MVNIQEEEFRQLRTISKQITVFILKMKKKPLWKPSWHTAVQHEFRQPYRIYELLAADKSGKAMSAMLDRITTNHTFFMGSRRILLFQG
jgi:chemotaxis protein methyltransferase CheR